MRKNFLIILTAAISFVALPAFGDAVAVKDISGTVKTASGNDLENRKNSILFVERFLSGDKTYFQSKIFTINTDGTLKNQYTLPDYTVNKSVLKPRPSVIQKIELTVSDKRSEENSRNVMITSSGFSDGSALYGVKSIKSATDVDEAYQTTNDSDKVNIWKMDRLGIKGIDKDVLVYVSSPLISSDSGSLLFSFVTADRSEDGKVNLQTLQVDNDGLKDRFEVLKYSKTMHVAIATGDIDNDGYKNEIALFVDGYSGQEMEKYGAVRVAHIYSVSSPDGKNLKLNLIKSQAINDWNRGGGLSFESQRGPNVLVGDFDGDGRNEAAFITKTIDPYYSLLRKVCILKFDKDGNWQYQSTDYKGSSMPRGPVKAVKGDFDGDGKDEIVIFYLITNSTRTEYQLLEHWSCDKGSIKPHFDSITEFFPGVERVSDLSYFATDEHFSITAGPLTGRQGKTKLRDDLAISCVFSDGEDSYPHTKNTIVLVLPTILDSDGNFSTFRAPETIYVSKHSDVSRRGAIIASDFIEEESSDDNDSSGNNDLSGNNDSSNDNAPMKLGSSGGGCDVGFSVSVLGMLSGMLLLIKKSK